MRLMVSVMALLTLSAFASADVLVSSRECGSNGTFNSSGRRSQDYYFNVQDVSNGSYACWSAAKWTGLDLGVDTGAGEYVEDGEIVVSLRQSNAGFTTDGQVDIYVLADSVNPASNYTYNQAATVKSGGTFLGTVTFTEVSNGYNNVYSISDDAAVNSAADGTLVLGFFERGVVSATWAGHTNYTYQGPAVQLEGTVVPEPASMSLLALGGLAALARRRR